MQGDSNVQLVKGKLRNLFLSASSSPGKSYTMLSDIGVTIDKKGVLSLDEAKFDKAATDNFDDVVTILTNNSESKSMYSTLPQGLAGDAVKKLNDLTKSTGYIQSASDSAESSVERYKDDLERVEARMEKLLARYTSMFSTLNSFVSGVNAQKSSLKSTFDAMNNTKDN